MAKRKIPTGSKVRKVKSLSGDKHVVGSIGRVVEYCGTAVNPMSRNRIHGYMVKWETGTRNMVWDDGRLVEVKEMN